MIVDEDEGSVTRWVGALKAGGPRAVESLFGRYFEPLVALARRKASPRRSGAIGDEEDAALSAFYDFCRGAAEGKYPGLDDREGPWRLLATITLRKAARQVEEQSRLKRGGGAVLGESDLGGPEGGASLDQRAAPGPGPQEALMLVEECQRRIDSLGDEGLKAVARMRLEGLTTPEIASKLGPSPRTIANRLVMVRTQWSSFSRGGP